MACRFPFDWLQPTAQRPVVWLLGVLSVAIMMIFHTLGMAPPLITTAAPVGMRSYNLAGSEARARAVLASWPGRAREYALFLLGLDYLYLFIYPAFLALGGVRLAASLSHSAPRLATLGRALACLASMPDGNGPVSGGGDGDP